MPEFVNIHANGDSGAVVRVSQEFAEAIGATALADDSPTAPKPRKRTARKRAKSSARKKAASNTTTTGSDAAATPEEASK